MLQYIILYEEKFVAEYFIDVTPLQVQLNKQQY